MIVDTLDRLRTYAKDLPALNAIADFIDAHPLQALDRGRHDLADGIYVNVSDAALKSGGSYESHRRYLDLQTVIEGREAMDYLPLNVTVPAGEYSPENDFQLHTAPEEGLIRLAMVPGMFAVFFPQDAHRPCQGEPGSTVRKAVFKIPI